MNDRIIDLIKKLIRHERSVRKGAGTPEEAAAFAARIQRLCIQHKIDAENINVEEESPGAHIGDEDFPTGRAPKAFSRVSGEDSMLINVVAKAHFCEAIVITGTNLVTLVGEEQDRAVCKAMFEYLREQMRTGASRERRLQLQRKRTVRRFKHFFCVGFVNAIAGRYRQMREAADNTTTALVRADSLVKSYVDGKFKTRQRKSTALDGRKNWAALDAGHRHGHHVSLATNVVGKSEVVRGQLTE